MHPREPAWKRAKNQGYSRGLGNVSAAANRQTRKKTGGKSRGGREKHETSSEKKNRKSVGKRNYRLMRRSFHHVASERASAIDRCFTTKVIRVFVRPLFFLFFSKRLPVHVSTSHVFRNTAFAMIHRCRNPLSDSTETPTTDLEIR